MDDLTLTPAPTAMRPLLGVTVLLVEDSRFASEAIRLMCLRSGARIRRADSLETAKRHLAIYRPTVALVDVGLPDGSGLGLIRVLAQTTPRIEVVLGTSGDRDLETAVMQAGADGFMAKPLDSLLMFQSKILGYLPKDRQPPIPRDTRDEIINPDPVAYHDDLNHVAQVLDGSTEGATLDYVTQFLGGVARSAQDHDLGTAVSQLADARHAGRNPNQRVAMLSQMVQSRLAAAGPI